MVASKKFQRAGKPCNHPGCRALVRDGKAKCEQHRQAWVKRSDEPERMKGRALQEARSRLFRRSPLCAECERQGRVRLAVVRDHIVSMAEGGLDVEANTQGLCDPCHDAKTERERKRGIQKF